MQVPHATFLALADDCSELEGSPVPRTTFTGFISIVSKKIMVPPLAPSSTTRRAIYGAASRRPGSCACFLALDGLQLHNTTYILVVYAREATGFWALADLQLYNTIYRYESLFIYLSIYIKYIYIDYVC